MLKTLILAAALAAFGHPASAEVLSVTSNAVARFGFTVRLQIDLNPSNPLPEKLYAVPGAFELYLREAGADKALKGYDVSAGNYLNFPLADGSCPVLEACMPGPAGRVGVPLGFLAPKDGPSDVILSYGGGHWTISVDGACDDDMPFLPPAWPDRAEAQILSPRVRSAAFSAPADFDYYARFTERPITEPIQYWTPGDHNAWVGDVTVFVHKGRFHLFYLHDRRHHKSKGGHGGHAFAHLSTTDLVHWTEHPFATTCTEWWETHGTGTPFIHRGKFCLSYGLHTRRLVPDNRGRYPQGGYWAESDDDGFTFRKVGYRFTDEENPTMRAFPDGSLALYDRAGRTFLSPRGDMFDWRLVDDGSKRFVKGDCPAPFEWNGWHYSYGGFACFDASPSGKVGTFEDWAASGDDPYEGLAVPMVTTFGAGRRIVAGWIYHTCGWGGYLCLRELVQFPDGRLGSKWLPEAPVRGMVTTYDVEPGGKLLLRMKEKANGGSFFFEVDAAAKRAQFTRPDKAGKPVAQPTLAENIRAHAGVDARARVNALKGRPDQGDLYAVGKLRGLERPFKVRFAVWYDKKGDVTIFDAEIAGVRTMLSRQRGRYEPPERMD